MWAITEDVCHSCLWYPRRGRGMGKKKDLKKQWIKMFEVLQKKQIYRFKKLSEPRPIKQYMLSNMHHGQTYGI